MISTGCSIWNVGGLGPAGLAAKLAALLGSDLVGLNIGEDYVEGSASWAARVGPNPTITGAGRFSKGVRNGRAALVNTTDFTNSLAMAATSPTPVAVEIYVASVETTAPFGDYYTLAHGPQILALQGSDNYWYHGDTYVNGSLLAYPGAVSPLNTVCVLQRSSPTAASTTVNIGSWPAVPARNFKGAISCRVALASVPSAGVRGAVTDILRNYYHV